MKQTSFILSCEHAVNTIPPEYSSYFAAHQSLLETHRGFDLGAIEMALHLSQKLHCPLVCATASRLLIDCNRSLHHPHCFSPITRSLPKPLKQRIVDEYYHPYRQQVESLIEKQLAVSQRVIHLSIHSFTPVLNNIPRLTDIGLLYNSTKAAEKQFAYQWRKHLLAQTKQYRIRMNYPYRGIHDGFPTVLRKKFSPHQCIHLEIESNQHIITNPNARDDLTKYLSGYLFEI